MRPVYPIMAFVAKRKRAFGVIAATKVTVSDGLFDLDSAKGIKKL